MDHRELDRHRRTTTLDALLAPLARTSVDFYAVTGNMGDGLIAASCRDLLRRVGADVHEYRRNEGHGCRSASRIAVQNGGGGFIDLYNTTRATLVALTRRYERVYVMPATVAGERQRELFVSLPDNVIMCVRERVSYDYVRSLWKHAETNLWLTDDLAFSFDYGAFVRPGAGTLKAFRVDVEKTDVALPPENFDLSSHGDYLTPVEAFLNPIADRATIHTNRLHVSIAAAFLGKEVFLHRNSYFKNHAVYEYSMQHRFPNVHWMG